MSYYDAREVEIRFSIHEEVCAERYDKLFAMLEDNRKELKELRQLASMGSGAWKAMVGFGVILTLILTFLKISLITHFKE